jgi:hypothetical protein
LRIAATQGAVGGLNAVSFGSPATTSSGAFVFEPLDFGFDGIERSDQRSKVKP